MLSDYGNMDVMLGGRSSNSIERELDSLIDVPEGQRDFQSFPNRENSSQENEIRDIDSRNEPVRESRLIESINTLSSEVNARMSREMEAMMDLMQSQITRAISSAISERIIPEIQNMVENLPLGQNGVGPDTSLNEDRVRSAWENTNTRLTKKDSRSACDLREHSDVSPYTKQHLKKSACGLLTINFYYRIETELLCWKYEKRHLDKTTREKNGYKTLILSLHWILWTMINVDSSLFVKRQQQQQKLSAKTEVETNN